MIAFTPEGLIVTVAAFLGPPSEAEGLPHNLGAGHCKAFHSLVRAGERSV